MTGKGRSYGAITVINAMPLGKGATIGIDLKTEAKFTVEGNERIIEIVNDPDEDPTMAGYCVSAAYDAMDISEPAGWRLRIDSEIPVSRGLKSSSSACNAIITSVFSENHYKMDKIELIRLGVGCARKAKVTVTGSFDDACGCHLGGLVITDNNSDELICSRDLDETYDVVIYVPAEKIRKTGLPLEKLSTVRNEMEVAGSFAEFYPLKAMTMNGRIISKASGVDNSVAEMAINNGALGAGMSGSGPAIAIVLPKGDGRGFIEKTGLDNTILTTTRGLDL